MANESFMAFPRQRRLSSESRRRSSFIIGSDTESDDDHGGTPPPVPKRQARPPPSSFTFPFQAYAGNPDPGLPIPGQRRKSMSELIHPAATIALPRVSSANSLYHSKYPILPRNASVPSFRAPFLSPSSRPSSSLWAPPAYHLSPNQSATNLSNAIKPKPPLPSTRLTTPLAKDDKPWLQGPQPGVRSSYLITLLFILLGFIAAAVIAYLGYISVPLLDERRLCLVMDEQFSSASLDESIWNYDVQLGGFGNGEFQMTTKFNDNIYTSNGNLYIVPTLSSNRIDNVMDGGNYSLPDCTTLSSNRTACTAASDASRGLVINPVMSARINTKGKKSIRFGKVQIRAKLPKGDWLWPAVWMLPEQESYGPWPASGEIDIIEARGNAPTYPAQGNNYVRSTLIYGPFPSLYNTIYGWFSTKRDNYAKGFHTYTLEWDPSFIRLSIDSRLQSILHVDINKGKKPSFWDKADFPLVAQNSTQGPQVVVDNPYTSNRLFAPAAAPFDQPFYLIVNLAVGGTSGWFQDGVGGKMWYDASWTAMRDFARAQGEWYSTWGQLGQREERAFRIDYVKMWERC